MTPPVHPAPPQRYRWRLASYDGIAPDRLGALTDGAGDTRPHDRFLGELTACTAKVLARAEGADLVFVGRSLDSMYDLLTGAFEHSGWEGRLLRLPLSGLCDDDWGPAERHRLREHLAAAGLEPYALARRARPIALLDVVHQGTTFTTVHRQLADWIEESREPWPVIRRKLRYIGVTEQGTTSPHHWRWQQDRAHDWVRTLPAGHVVNVSLDSRMWSELADRQPKVTPGFPPHQWFDVETTTKTRHRHLAHALAFARALVEAGRSRAVRDALIRLMGREPGFAGREQRRLALALRAGPRTP
ncbi:hypothetical protein OHS70_29915 [Streptomyces sp. NBC_00390]|uniref:hypothetical protein n=1 Tax=Streptomyces sp. NBC_00390 TaxID=2975736 RepID=UPI002E1B0B90